MAATFVIHRNKPNKEKKKKLVEEKDTDKIGRPLRWRESERRARRGGGPARAGRENKISSWEAAFSDTPLLKQESKPRFKQQQTNEKKKGDRGRRWRRKAFEGDGGGGKVMVGEMICWGGASSPNFAAFGRF